MAYQTTITQKGQITIPKEIRDILHLGKSKKVLIELEESGTTARIVPAYDFLEVAKKIKVKKKINPITARAQLESGYVR